MMTAAASPKRQARASASNRAAHGTTTKARAKATPIFGDVKDNGFEITYHQALSPQPIEWSLDLNESPDAFHFCFNLSGWAMLRQGPAAAELQPNSLAFLHPNRPDRLSAVRAAQQKHEFLSMTLGEDYLADTLSPYAALLVAPLKNLLFPDQSKKSPKGKTPALRSPSGQLKSRNLSADDKLLVSSLRHPPVNPAAQSLWFESKLHEFFALRCVEAPPEEQLFCTRQKNLQLDRVEKTKAYLAQHLDEKLDLSAVARAVGCSQHYLCRIFSATAGITISRFLRCLRINRACQLLREGRFNVTEVALEVGYQSLSHFSKAFFEEKGVHPSKF
ncbi:MAG: AraC family transcriptional regulator [Verrucomicrobiota bacterium]